MKRALPALVVVALAGGCTGRGLPSVGKGPAHWADAGATDGGAGGDLAPSDLATVPDLPPPQPLDINPAMVTLLIGGKQTFTTDRPATFSVVEAAHAGRIDAAGHYLAPSSPGVVHVQAVAADGGRAQATITVTPGTMTLLGGKLGGPGNGDGVGDQARFNGPSGIAFSDGKLYVGDFINRVVRVVDVHSRQVTTPDWLRDSFISATAGWAWDANVVPPAVVDVAPAGRLLVASWHEDVLVAADLSAQSTAIFSGALNTPGAGDGSATTARYMLPVAVSDDGGATLYVADGQTIRAVDSVSGAVTTLAGAANMPGNVDDVGKKARFDSPMSVASDGQGHLYIADYGNNAVRRLTLAGGAVDTVAKGTAWELPMGVSWTGGALYVSEESCISRVASDGSVSIVAGARSSLSEWDDSGAAARLFRPQAMTSDGAGGLYVGDAWGQTIRHVDLQTSAVTTIAGSAIPTPWNQPSGLRGPDPHQPIQTARGIASDDKGNLYVADLWGGAVARVTPAGSISTLATGLTAPNSVAFDGQGTLYIADGTSLKSVSVAGGSVSVVAGAPGQPGYVDDTGGKARFHSLGYVAFAGGIVYGSDTGSYAVRRIDVGSGAVTTLAGSGTQGSVDATGRAAAFENPEGLALDGAGKLYVADTLNLPGLRRVDLATAAVTTVKATPNAPDGRFHFGAGVVALASDGDGRVYVAMPGGVQVIDVTTGGVDTLAGSAGRSGVLVGALPSRMTSPAGIVLTPSGLIVSDEDALLVLTGR